MMKIGIDDDDVVVWIIWNYTFVVPMCIIRKYVELHLMLVGVILLVKKKKM
jgi:hypothetical protein